MKNTTAITIFLPLIVVLPLTVVISSQTDNEKADSNSLPITNTVQSTDLDEPFSKLLIGILSNDTTLTSNAINEAELLNRSTNEGELPIHIAVSLNYADIVNILLTQSTAFDVNQRTKTGQTPLLIAVQNGSVEIARMLLDAGGDPNIPSIEEDGVTINDIALQHHNPSLVRLFDTNKADSLEESYIDRIREEELFDAVLENDMDSVETYFILGGQANISDQNGWTPFAHAVSQGHTEMVTLFIEQGEDINQMYGRENITALMIAAANNYASIVRLLLKKGANPNLKQHQNLSALDYANAMGHSDISDIIDKNTKQKDIFTAAKEGDVLFITDNSDRVNQLYNN